MSMHTKIPWIRNLRGLKHFCWISQAVNIANGVKTGGYMKWLIVFVTTFVLMFGGAGGMMAEDDVPMGIFNGLMTELVEVRTYKGDITNHTFFKIDYAFLPLVAHKVSDPVIVGELAPGETQDVALEAGDYILVAFATMDGEFKGHWQHEFRIVENGSDGYGFDIRAGKPPVTL